MTRNSESLGNSTVAVVLLLLEMRIKNRSNKNVSFAKNPVYCKKV